MLNRNPKHYLALAFMLLVAPCLLAEETASEPTSLTPDKTYEINKINIEALDAFDPRIPQYRSWPFRFLNKLHNRTNDAFIERELLVREGDILDADMLAETKRNLRKHSFLGEVDITPRIVGANKVDLDVRTEDQWTLQVNVSAGKSAGFSTFEFEVEESNFLGLGKTLGLGYNRDPERTTYNFLYFDPQFMNSRWRLGSNFQETSDGWRYTTDIVRPFFSMDTRWAYGMSWDSGTLAKPLHDKAKTVAEIDTEHRSGVFFAARSWGERYNKRKLGLLFSTEQLMYPRAARIILPEAATVKKISKNLHPIDRESYQYGALFKWEKLQFIEEKYLDNFGRVEDLPVGLEFGAVLLKSENIQPVPDFLQFNAMTRYNQQLSSSQYLSLMADFSGRRLSNGNLSNLMFNSYAHYYLKLPNFNLGPISFPRQTFAANLATTLTHEIEAPFQISLGENEGLRGYTFKSFTGQNRVLFNMEDRIFTPLDFRLFAVGLVGFIDAGYVWSSEEHLRFNDLGVSAGVGLRIGLKKSQSARVVRIDFSVPLKDETSRFTQADNKGYSLSISSGHIFSISEALPRLFQLF